MDSKKKSINSLKMAAKVALMLNAAEAISVGVLKCIDALETDSKEQREQDICSAAAMIMKIIAESLSNKNNVADDVLQTKPADAFSEYCVVIASVLDETEPKTPAIENILKVLKNATN